MRRRCPLAANPWDYGKTAQCAKSDSRPHQ
jgi:hypothetical protein